ncbi:MAG TPA: hypothetical protein VFL94_10605 [Actinomycetales bacterium]|nr:hypothetical protein [Actinomycetales bacterium]
MVLSGPQPTGTWPPLPTWECPAGTVLCWRAPGVLRATGIRNARAERFGRPQREPRSREPIDASRWSPACPQPPSPLLQDLLPGAMGDLTVDEEHAADAAWRMPLLFGDRDIWQGMPLVAGTDWKQADVRGQQLRRLWADFARTGHLETGRRPGLITVRRLSTLPTPHR